MRRDTYASLRRLADVADYIVDERVGIVRMVTEVPVAAGAPNFFHFNARACNAGAFAGQSNFATNGGASSDRGLALAKAIGECVERYSAALYELDDLPLCSAAEAPFECADPAEFALCGPAQYRQPDFPYVPFERTTRVRWTPAVEADTGKTVYAPAAFVWIPYFFYKDTGDSPIGEPISTGLACHCSYEEAACAGLCEVIERDAIMIMWQARLSMPQIRVETLSEANYDLVQRFERTGDAVTLLNITNDVGVPTIAAVLTNDDPERAALVVAASSNLDPEVATRKALEELVHTRRYAYNIKQWSPRLEPDPTFANVKEQRDHLNLYSDQANRHLADFLFASKVRQDFEDVPWEAPADPREELDALVRKVRAVGHRVLLADLTSEDVGGLGLRVVRAVVPGLHPLILGYAIRALGGRRLWEVPRKLGYAGIRPETGDNPAPHPYP
jgi:ribosomal protein S12 methylthiotransferase accessory factor